MDRRRIELLLKRCKRPVLPLSLTAHIKLARELGIEPRTTESKSVVLPLHHSRTKTWRPLMDSNHRHAALETAVLPTELRSHYLVEAVGIEPI